MLYYYLRDKFSAYLIQYEKVWLTKFTFERSRRSPLLASSYRSAYTLSLSNYELICELH